eukprot:gene1326-1672_t
MDRNRCEQFYPTCRFLTFTSCCGKQNGFCVRDNGSGCQSTQLSCGKNSNGEIYEFWSSCKPRNGWTDYYPPNATCDSLRCESRGQSCEYVDSTPCSGTSCCPRHPQCSGGASSGSSGSGSCGGVNCQPYESCQMVNGRPTCVIVRPSTGGSSSSSSSSSSTTGSPSCANILCAPGQYCAMVNGIPTCLLFPSTASTTSVLCAPGQYCAVVNGIATCLWSPTGSSSSSSSSSSGSSTGHKLTCDDIKCHKGKVCIMKHGHPKCISKHIDLCDHVFCDRGQKCIEINGRAKCVWKGPTSGPTSGHTITGPITSSTGPTSGGFVCRNCLPGQYCALVSGIPTCQYPTPTTTGGNNCGQFNCRPDQQCVNVNGYLQCIPRNNTSTSGGQFNCGQFNCLSGQYCINVNGFLQCLTVPSVTSTSTSSIGTTFGGTSTTTSVTTTGITTGGITTAHQCGALICSVEEACLVVDNEFQCIPPIKKRK